MPETEAKEYNFAVGLKELESRIEEKLKEKDFIVVAFNATGINVGKTYVSGKLAQDLRVNGIQSLVCGDLSLVRGWKDGFLSDIKYSDKKKGVIILEAQFGDFVTYKNNTAEVRKRLDNEVKKEIGQDLKVNKIDIVVGLCRPDKPFIVKRKEETLVPLADMIINNELAIDDPRKMK